MKKSRCHWGALAVIAASMAIASQAQAAWTFNSNSTAVNDTASNPDLLSVSGVFAANGGSYTNSTTYSIGGFGTGATGTSWQGGTSTTLDTLNFFAPTGGLGMGSDGTVAPNHAIDNGPATTGTTSMAATGIGNTEAVLLNFKDSVVLSNIAVGYWNGDADISLFRYKFAGAPAGASPLVGTGTSLVSMTAAGWELVQNKADLAVDTTTPYNSAANTVNTGGLGSSWWLISAYNTAYGGASTTLTQGNDYFKLLGVAGSKCVGSSTQCGTTSKVPEPSSLALLGVGVLGALAVRRRRITDQPL